MMKKILGALLVIITLVGYFYFFDHENEKKEEAQPIKVWKVEKLVLHKDISHKNRDKNSSLPNQKPMVSVYGFTIMSVGDTITLHSKAEDKDGKIVSYLWQEKDKILGKKPELPLMLSTEGEHIITLRVTDNLGAMAKDNIKINVYAPYDKKTFYKHRGCSCQALTYSYYNDEGNLTKEIRQSDKSGTVIKEFTYNENGELLSMHYKNYYDESHLIEDSTHLYDKFGNETEEFGQEEDYSLEDTKLVSFYNRYKYNEQGRMIEISREKSGVVESSEIHTYTEQGATKRDVYEEYKDGVLDIRRSTLYTYNENGNILTEVEQEYNAKTDTTTSSKEERRYNDAGKVEEKLEIDANGEIESYKRYTYDDSNHLVEERYKSDEERSERITSYRYTTDGLLLEEETKSEEGTKYIEHYTYNNDGKVTLQSTDSDGDGLSDSVTKIFYDEEGNRRREESYNHGELSSVYSYNSDGNIIENKHTSYTTKFIYDEDTGVLKHKIIEEHGVKVSISDYDEAGELVKEVDKNGDILYFEERR